LSFFPPKLAHIHGTMTIFSCTWRFRKLKGLLRALLHSEGPRLQRFDQRCIDETTYASIRIQSAVVVRQQPQKSSEMAPQVLSNKQSIDLVVEWFAAAFKGAPAAAIWPSVH
jgi:hypothetical protein